jgi:DNA-binding CsgD family transcriptional regulator
MLRSVSSEKDLHGQLAELATRLGFDHFVYCTLGDYGQRLGTVINGYPAAWADRYVRNDYVKVDPVMHHCLRSVTPLAWHPSAFGSEQERTFFNEAGEHGVGLGMSCSVRGRGGEMSILSFASNSFSRAALQHVHDNLAVGQLLTCYVHEATDRLFGRAAAQEVQLSAREQECLKWAAGGKSNWQIGRIMNITEHGVGFHFRNIFRKLGVSTRQQAIVRAMLLGLL